MLLVVSSSSCSYASAAWSSNHTYWLVITNKSWNMNWADWSKRPDSFLRRLPITLCVYICVALLSAPSFFIFLLLEQWIRIFKNRLRSLLRSPGMALRSVMVLSRTSSNIAVLTRKNLGKSARLIGPFVFLDIIKMNINIIAVLLMFGHVPPLLEVLVIIEDVLWHNFILSFF